MTRGKLTLPEIGSQAEALKAAWEQLKKQEQWAQTYVGNTAYDEVVFIGSGSSYYQAQVMATTFKLWLDGAQARCLPRTFSCSAINPLPAVARCSSSAYPVRESRPRSFWRWIR